MQSVPRSCATCDEVACDMHKLLRLKGKGVVDRVAWILDDVWPETASMVAASLGPDDQLIAPGILGAWPGRYGWPGHVRHSGSTATARRHWMMRRVARSSGAVRQQAYIQSDRLVARELARRIDYRCRHLVIAQSWLPWLDEIGVLGGRTFDVMMSRYPFAEIHRMLDAAAMELGSSATISDFRVDRGLVDRESALLARAMRLITPHHGIAGLFGERATVLTWHKPTPRGRKPGDRTAFLGPTIARQRPDVACRVAAGLQEPLIVFGEVLEPMWGGFPIELRRMGPDWLNDIGAIIHPATITHQPRPLLEARANGVSVYATESCGLDKSDFRPLGEFSPATLA